MNSNETSPSAQTDGKWSRGLTATVALLCGALFLDAMDVSSTNVALPTIGSHLHMSASSLQWVVSGYVLGYGGFLLLGGRAADLLGRRRVFLSALAVFAVASAVGGVVDSGTALIAARFVKGVGAAFTVPAGLSILTTTFPDGAARNKALGAYAATGAVGFSLGLVFGGLLSEVGWRYVFLIPAPLAALLVLAGLRILNTPDPPSTADRHYDLPGAITVTASMVALVYSVVEAPSRGWADSRTIGGLAISAGLLAAFVAIEKRSAAPLIRLGILRIRTLLSADIAAMLYFGSYLGFQFLATLYVQNVAGWSPIDTALAFLPSGAFLPILGSQAQRIIGRFGTQKLIAAALIAFAAGYALFLREDSQHLNYATMLLPSMIVIGIGWGLGYPALNVRATAGIEGAEQGLAAGLFNTSFQIGGAIILAVVAAVLSSHLTAGSSRAHAVLASLHPAIAILIPVALAGVAVIAALNPRGRAAATDTSSEAELAVAEGAEGL